MDQEEYDSKTYTLFEGEDLKQVLEDLEQQKTMYKKDGLKTNGITKRINSLNRLLR